MLSVPLHHRSAFAVASSNDLRSGAQGPQLLHQKLRQRLARGNDVTLQVAGKCLPVAREVSLLLRAI